MKHAMTFLSAIVLIVYAAVGLSFANHAKPVGLTDYLASSPTGTINALPVSMESAINCALRAEPGRAFKAEVQKKNNYPVYLVEIIRNDKQIVKVTVDSKKNTVLNVEVDNNLMRQQR